MHQMDALQDSCVPSPVTSTFNASSDCPTPFKTKGSGDNNLNVILRACGTAGYGLLKRPARHLSQTTYGPPATALRLRYFSLFARIGMQLHAQICGDRFNGQTSLVYSPTNARWWRQNCRILTRSSINDRANNAIVNFAAFVHRHQVKYLSNTHASVQLQFAAH